jgi:hypothetical protein
VTRGVRAGEGLAGRREGPAPGLGALAQAPSRGAHHSPQLNFLTGVSRARSGPISSALPWNETPLFGPIASTTIAARGSLVRFRNLTPSTSNSNAPSSVRAYMTGTTCGHPDGPTVASRAMRCDRKNSSSLGENTINEQILVRPPQNATHPGDAAKSGPPPTPTQLDC